MLALLKEKSKVGVASKPRKKYEAYMPKKKPNPPDDPFLSELAKYQHVDAQGKLKKVQPPRAN